jgi:hypothetical protein
MKNGKEKGQPKLAHRRQMKSERYVVFYTTAVACLARLTIGCRQHH